MKKCFTLLVLLFFLFIADIKAQSSLQVNAQIRPRTEYRHGFKRLIPEESNAAFFTEQRSRLSLNYATSDFSVFLSLQDVRIWGSVDQIYKRDPALTSVNEAWGQYNFNKKISVRAGRQQLDYDNARFLGDLDWAQQARSHDLVLLMVQDSTWALHGGAAFNQDALIPEFGKLESTYYSTVNNYKTMQYIWFHKDFLRANFSLLGLNNGIQISSDSSVNFTQTLGFFGNLLPGKVKLQGEFYYQTGKDRLYRSVQAYLASLSGTFKAGNITTITLGGDYVSGTGPGDQINRSFDPLYGTNHAFYGLMDYFYVGSGHGQQGRTTGLIDIFLKMQWRTGVKSALQSHLHYFHSPVEILVPENLSNSYSSRLGTEIDLVYNLNVSKEVNFKLGYSQLFGTPALEAIKGGDRNQINNWAWCMITFNPTLFSN
ncbi:alginate export family protein [soil metagenome]